MILNPYYLIFSLLFKVLNNINVKNEAKINDILFLIYSILFLIFIPHFFVMLWKLEDHELLTVSLGINKHIFGLGFALSFWLINYLLFERRNRYLKVIECYENASLLVKSLNITLLIVYFSIPFILMIMD